MKINVYQLNNNNSNGRSVVERCILSHSLDHSFALIALSSSRLHQLCVTINEPTVRTQQHQLLIENSAAYLILKREKKHMPNKMKIGFMCHLRVSLFGWWCIRPTLWMNEQLCSLVNSHKRIVHNCTIQILLPNFIHVHWKKRSEKKSPEQTTNARAWTNRKILRICICVCALFVVSFTLVLMKLYPRVCPCGRAYCFDQSDTTSVFERSLYPNNHEDWSWWNAGDFLMTIEWIELIKSTINLRVLAHTHSLTHMRAQSGNNSNDDDTVYQSVLSFVLSVCLWNCRVA